MSSTTFQRFPSRRAFLGGLTSGAAFLAAPALAKTTGDFRTAYLVNNRTGDWLKTVYWADGDYIPDAMEAINYLMRDWRREEVTRIDPRTVDIISAVHRMLECDEPFEVVSGYRSPQTNAALRSRNRGVARNSYHMRGMAADLTLKTRSVRQMASAGKALGAGGVGRYSRSKFIHLDSGPVRDWGR